ncbi:MAG: MFS transporter, partial [Solirubrobacteraceae bacterium]
MSTATAPAPSEAAPAAGRHLGATLFLSCLAQFMVILDVSVVNVALPAIRGGLHFTEVDLQWVVNAYTVTFAGFLLLGGRAADLLGRRRVFVGGLLLFALASLAGGIADS